jgi:hypothetical protein
MRIKIGIRNRFLRFRHHKSKTTVLIIERANKGFVDQITSWAEILKINKVSGNKQI